MSGGVKGGVCIPGQVWVLSGVERTILTNYAASKYDLPISTALDAYAGDQSSAGDFDEGVFGIGNSGVDSLLENASDGLGLQATLRPHEFVMAGSD